MRKLGVLRRLRISIPMAASIRRWFYPFLTTRIWPGKGVEKLLLMLLRVNSIEPRSQFFQILVSILKNWMISLGLLPLINRRKLHIVLLTRKCPDGSVPLYLNNYFNINASVHSVTTRRCNNSHIPKVNIEVAKRSFFLHRSDGI